MSKNIFKAFKHLVDIFWFNTVYCSKCNKPVESITRIALEDRATEIYKITCHGETWTKEVNMYFLDEVENE
jgi:hypothetical protein